MDEQGYCFVENQYQMAAERWRHRCYCAERSAQGWMRIAVIAVVLLAVVIGIDVAIWLGGR